MVEFIGRAISHTAALEVDVAARLQDLWQVRLEEARSAPAEHRHELAAFGWWFANRSVDATWRLDQLLDVLRLVGSVQPNVEVVTHLAQLVNEHPRTCAEALSLMIRGDETSWWVHGRPMRFEPCSTQPLTTPIPTHARRRATR